ncbi:MAG: RagB/SusD family nutrient uptake outer membrane protein [Prevotellaceae bacterium]|jgi:hypothetical protein|nr:RagB/SusD family nutrient uptake outer membrane protein [Prevotellaceae bacterium]
MKKIITYITIGWLALGMFSCADDALETVPTDAMSTETLFATAEAAMVPLNGLYRAFYEVLVMTGNTHQCFGLSAYNLMADVMAEDMIMSASGSGWFWYDCIYNVKTRYESTGWRPYDLWRTYYKYIANINYIIASEETMGGEPSDVNYAIGQAYALRAYSYFMLIQSFARTYKGHESDPGVPLYTEPTAAGTAGKPRATVQEVYTQITADIDKAVELLGNASARRHITHVDQSVALGFQARIASVMEDWAKAQSAAEAAITASKKSIGTGATILSGMNDALASNVMWGAHIIADQSGMYAGFFTHMDAEAGYYGATALKQINKLLYNEMGSKDVRRAWWDPEYSGNGKGGYQQEKFKFADVQTWLGDYIWMRVEEMYLTAAEAACQQGNDAKAREHLMALMSKRDADFKCDNKSGKALGKLTTDLTGSLLEEILIQRRIELWGEFGRIYDIRRLRQGFKRTLEMGWPEGALIPNTATDDPESYAWVMTIPQVEFDGNKELNQAKDQNPVGDYPN